MLDRWLPADVAGLLDDLDDDEDLATLHMLEGPQRARVFEYLDRPTQTRLLSSLPEGDVRSLLHDIADDDRTALLTAVDDDVRERLLTLLSQEQRSIAELLLTFPEDSVGRLMTPHVVAVRPHWTVQHVLDHIRQHGQDSETLNVVYIVDREGKLVDDLRIRQLLLARPGQTVQTLLDNTVVSLKAADPKRSAVDVFREYDRTALPVVDGDNKLLGVVTVDDVLDVAEQAATGDIQKFGGLEALDEPYDTTPLLTMVRKRATWLVLLFLGEMLTAWAMGIFEKEIAKAVVLALFLPLIISSGGNSGSQAATLIVRALALAEIKLGDWFKVFRRELASGLMLGVLLGAIGFLRIFAWHQLFNSYGSQWALVGLAVSLSLIGIVLWGTISGSMLPFLLKLAGVDPATSSAPFVATLVDVTGLFIYFYVASVVLLGRDPPPIAPSDALQAVGKPMVVVEMKVAGVDDDLAGSGLLTLRPDEAAGGKEPFGVAIVAAAAARLKEQKPGDLATRFTGKTVQVRGSVTRLGDRTFMAVTDPEQIEILRGK